jgi:penicillin-binding protein 2
MKKTTQWLLTLFLLLSVVACNSPQPVNETAEPAAATPTLPAPQVHVTPAPDLEAAVFDFFGAWQVEDYAAMYARIAAESQNSITEADFIDLYLSTAAAMTLKFDTGIEYRVVSTLTNPDSGQAQVQVNYNTNLFGTLSRDLDLTLVQESGSWRVVWDAGVILPELRGGNSLEIMRVLPDRGNIYANDGSPMAAQEDVVAIGFTPANLDEDLMSLFFSTMARLTIYQVDEIIELYDNALPYDFVPLGEVPQSEVEKNMSALSALSGVYLNYYSSRFYYDGGLAPQTVGHLTYISEEELNRYLRLGYAPNERFGSAGLEFSYEDELSGERGASLYLKDPNGQIITKLAEKGMAQGQSLYTTIDPTLQYYLQQSLGDYRGAIVVMEIDTGRVLAMVSNPQFDPNLFDINNENIIYSDNPYFVAGDPVFNRAVKGQYPLGSVFKIVTMAAALETGVFDETSEIYCGHSLEVCGNELFDWTYEKEKPPSGDLTLPEGLMRSCNPWFYHIGESLVFEGYPNAIADMARSFGLGQVTGVQVPEEPGNIPAQTATCELNTQLAIGQGEMTVTPLQVAAFIAAIGNGGTLYRPTVIDQVAPEEGTPSYTFEPEAVGTLPVSDANLAIIQEAMRSVITNARGTAHIQLATMRFRAYGKTGTAQNPFGNSHAWFAGYTSVGNSDRPDIAVVVILENAGEGSEMAAPVFRRAVSLYFSNYVDYGYVMPWEAYPYVVASPTPVPTDTPIGYEGPTEEPEE